METLYAYWAILKVFMLLMGLIGFVGILLITKQLEKKHEVRKINSIVIAIAFGLIILYFINPFKHFFH